MLDEVQQTGVGPLEVLEHQHGRPVIRNALEEEAPGREQHVAPSGGSLLDTEQGQERRTDVFALARVGTNSASVASTAARVVDSSASSVRPHRRRTISPSAQSAIPSP